MKHQAHPAEEAHESLLVETINGIENTLKSFKAVSFKRSDIEPGLSVCQLECTGKSSVHFSFPFSRTLIAFCYAHEGEFEVGASVSEELLHLDAKRMVMFSYPFADWDAEFKVKAGARMLFIFFSIEKLHSLFGSNFGADRKNFEVFLKSYKQKKHYDISEMTPSISICFHQLFSNQINAGLIRFFQLSKIMEFLTFYMNKPMANPEIEAACPFIKDEEEIERIRRARAVITEQMTDPPTLKELAKLVGTNEFKLKVGFKNLYGNTVYGYLNDIRMQTARELIEVKKLQIQEVSTRVGYSNPSHFITAYKKKFGVTPRKHVRVIS